MNPIELNGKNWSFKIDKSTAKINADENIKSIPTSKISSVAAVYTDNKNILYGSLAILIAVGALSIFTGTMEVNLFGVGIFILGLIVYYLSRERVLKISSNSASINIDLTNYSKDETAKMVDSLEAIITG